LDDAVILLEVQKSSGFEEGETEDFDDGSSSGGDED